MGTTRNDRYLTGLVEQLWKYAGGRFPDYMFDGHRPPSPPIFAPEFADNNVLLRPGAGDVEKKAVLSAIPGSRRHRFFGSMKSSQALAQSVVGNLTVLRKWELLSGLTGDDGKPLFFAGPSSELQAGLEYEVGFLSEKTRARTTVDLLLAQGSYRIAVECKLAEPDFGRCSRPLVKPGASDYERDFCDGNFLLQQARPFRCSLGSVGARYWEYIPQLFPQWWSDGDHCPCPLNRAYQLTRSVLAACVSSDNSVDLAGGHVVLVYDERNPAFSEAGEAGKIYGTVKNALGDPALLNKTSWQRVVACLRQDADMDWLVSGLAEKYGIE